MSRFDDLDHRLGLHDSQPHPDCSICHPDLPAFTAAPEPRWDYGGPGAPAFPDWGSIWNHRGEIVTFVNPHRFGPEPKETDARDMGGFWTPVHKTTSSIDKPIPIPMSKLWSQEPRQMEFGSGKWSPRAKVLSLTNTIPDEAGLSSPLGVDLLQWAKDQNHAKFIVEMGRNRLFPISEIQHERSTKPIISATLVTSAVMTIPMEPLAGLLSD